MFQRDEKNFHSWRNPCLQWKTAFAIAALPWHRSRMSAPLRAASLSGRHVRFANKVRLG
jgi:hypothetical protein